MPPSTCNSTECCPDDPYDYQAADAEDSDAGTGAECPDVHVTITPTSGSYVFFPSYVVLEADHEDAVIRYTTDGTDPSSSSTLYSAPFEITQAGILIKARAFLTGCSPGPIATALYQNTPFLIAFDYSCVTPDKVGIWDVWAPNGNIDSFWQLEFTLTGNQAITRLEMRQLSALGEDNTGILYSTDSPLEIDGEDVEVMPLGLFIGGVQQHTDYQSSLGTFGAATHTWDLYGDKRFSSDGAFFQLTMVLGDGSSLTAIKNTHCNNVVNPQPCPSPAAPTVTGHCDGEVTVSFVNSAPQNFRVYQSQVGSPGGWTLVASGTTAASPHVASVTGLTPGELYYFRVELEYSGCGFQSSIPVAGLPLPDAEVTISTDKAVVNPNESFTISWTSQYVGGATCGGCADGEVSLNQSLGCKSGNASGSQATSKASPGIYTYEITGCNACGTVTASVQVEVLDVATCSVQPSIINIPNPASFLCGFESGCSIGAYGIVSPWNGQMPKVSDCNWAICADGGCLASGGVIAYISLCVWCYLSGGVWVLEVGTPGSPNGHYWRGTKGFGNSPLGTYTRVSGCATGPATITIT